MERETLAGRAKAIIDRLASAPRAAGSANEANARGFCADYLTSLGFTVSEEQFTYSALPGRFAVPFFGLLSLIWFGIVGAGLDRPAPEQTVRAGLPFLIAIPVLYGVALRMVRRSRLLPRRATNLVAVRGGAPHVWLMAHLDSKSQPVPMLVRIGGIIMAAGAMALTVVLGVTPVIDWEGPVWIVADVAGILGSLAVLFSTVGNRSPGAVDNATGVSAALLTAAESSEETPLGVVLTSGEELGLAGAWAWVQDQAHRYPHSPRRYAVNFDSLDDVGTLTCMADADNSLADSVRGLEGRSDQVRLRRVLPGIMVDATALNDSGWEAVTLSKGNLGTLARIHSARDTAGRLTGQGVAEAVELAAALIRKQS